MLKKNFIIISLLFLQIIISKAEQLSDKVTPESFDSISIETQLPELKNSLQKKNEGKKVISNDWMIVTANPYASVAGAEILKKGGILVIHRHKNSKDIIPEYFEIVEEKKYGISKVIFLLS